MPAQGGLTLTPASPVVTLGRLTSGIGSLTIQPSITADESDLAFGCCYALDAGPTSFLSTAGQRFTAPPDSRLPLLAFGRERLPRLSIDLRQVRDLSRATLVLHSRARTETSWAGALLVTTHAGQQITVPLSTAPAAAALTVASLYQVDGELVLRAELQPALTPRAACEAFGFTAIAWLDDSTAIA